MQTFDYTDKVVLITGGTGSFGKTMAMHLLKNDVREIRIYSRDEAKQHQMRIDFADARLKFFIGDVRDSHSLNQVCAGANLVFHAAALKQVPSCEFFPMQAVMTNVTGSANVIDACQNNNVESVVCLSTDKAVQPVNAMGMTKALMEKVAQASNREQNSNTVVSTVRYGNVIYSRGSVIPLFVEQAKSSIDLTITDPEMTRFLMPLEQCVDLVEHAFFHAKPGDIFVRKASAATMQVVADAVIEMFGSTSNTKLIGTRHGEKLYETLVSAEELARSEDMGNYYRVSMDGRDLNYEDYFEKGNAEHSSNDDYHSHNTTRLTVDEVIKLLKQIPEIQEELRA